MAYMDLMRGLRSGERVQYPIFDMELLSAFTVGIVSAGGSIWPPFLSVVYADNADISAAFPDGIPPTVESDGVVCQNDYKYVSGSPAWTLKTQAFSGLAPTATPPDDWSTNFFDYYTASTRTVSGNTFAVFTSVASNALSYHNSPPTWNPNTSYYHDDLPLKQRAAHIFTTDAAWSFGVNISPNWQYGYIRAVANCNPEHALVGTDDVFCIHDPIGNQYGGYIPSDTLAPYQLQTGFTNSIPFLQIFVHCLYNDTDYYGIAQILMSAASESAHPIGIRMLAFPAECYGDSIKTGEEPQEGTWGPAIERAGGSGSFSDPSDDSGSFNGAALAADIAAHAAVMNANIQAGGFHVYRLAAGAMAAISRVLFSQSFFGLFTVSRYNPLSCILSYHLLPDTLAPLTLGGQAQTAAVQAGGYNFQTDPDAPVQVPAQSLVDSETHYFVGAADIPLYYDAFPDFAPFTQAKIHLPYIGEMSLDINKFQGGRIAVDYNCDVISGNVCAVITCQDRNGRYREVYTATGNAAYTLPVFSESQSGAAVGKLIGSGVTAAVTGNAAGVLGAAAGALEMAAVGVPHSPQIQGSFGGNVGAIGNHICFLEITRPEWVETERFQELAGIPSGLSGTIADLGASGFIQVQTIETDGIATTQAECDLIEQILKSGIYLK